MWVVGLAVVVFWLWPEGVGTYTYLLVAVLVLSLLLLGVVGLLVRLAWVVVGVSHFVA